VAEPMTEEPAKVVDLMAALEASVKEAKAARKRHPAAGEAEADAAPAKKRARKSA
jgi:DNA end-binding protein Ku